MFPKSEKGFMSLAERAVRAIERRAEDVAEEAEAPRAVGSNYIPMTVESFDNHIYFWAGVNTDRCLDLIKRIRQLDNDLRTQSLSRMLPSDHPPVPIWLHIQSNGGELFTGLNVADQLATIKTPIFSIVEGICASAATLISMACTKRYVLSGSFLLIHQLSSWGFGTYEQLQDDMHINDMLMDRLYGFYAARTKFNRAKIKALLRRDTWLSAEEAVEAGFCDEIMKG